ncbi:MAG: asparagine synthase (glutamine-hydrolyzing) [Candidatus Omnitrophota bacterium]
MCAIAGIISKARYANFISDCGRMLKFLRHRGPDDQGFFIDEKEGVYLGHNRLSIIDLSERGRQPFFNEDKSVVVLVNGEIYNYKSLRSELKARGHVFYSDSDSETVVHAYEEWKEDSINRLRGMFAICIWDLKDKKLILARDSIGIKPLYYLKTDKIFAFASEAKGFLGLNEGFWKPQINTSALEMLLAFPFIFEGEATLLSGVNKVPAGALLIYKGDGSLTLKKYWQLGFNAKRHDLGFKETSRQLEERLTEAVRLHLQSDVKLGVLLSGGLDSSLISALSAKVSRQPISTFTVGNQHLWDERPYAQKVAKHILSAHTSIEVNPQEVTDKIEELAWFYDDLSTLDPGIITTYLISEKIKQFGIKVLLVGEGGDEVFGGYSWYGLSQLPFKFMPMLVRDWIYYYAISRRLPGAAFFKQAMLMHRLIQGSTEKDIFRQIAGFEIKYQLPNHYLMKVDKGTMAHSLEARVPYLDRDIVEFAYNLPAEFKLRSRWFSMRSANEKLILRDVATRYLPAEVAYRKKRGFSLSIPQVLRSNTDKIKDYVLSKDSISREAFPLKRLEQLFDFKETMYSPFDKEKEYLLWKLFLIEAWRKKYILSNQYQYA